MKRRKEDLRQANPQGRIDVLAYHGAKKLTEMLGEKFGLQGVWDHIEPHAQEAAKSLFGDIKLGTEGKVLLGIIQSNPHLVLGKKQE